VKNPFTMRYMNQPANSCGLYTIISANGNQIRSKTFSFIHKQSPK